MELELDLSDFHPAFYEEAAEHLSSMEESLLKLERNPESTGLIATIFRGAHSIKGGSGMVGLQDIADFTHGMENMLDLMREGEMTTTPDRVALLLRATDTLGRLINATQEGCAVPEEIDAIIAEVEAQIHGNNTHGATADAAEAVAEANEEPTAAPKEAVSEIESATVLKPEEERLESTKTEAPINAGAAPAARSHGASSESSSIRVSVEKVDELINLVGELSIVQSMIDQAVRDQGLGTTPVLQESLQSLQRSTRELQERVMSVRMIPVATLFRRFPRVVRDLGALTGKQVSVEISGEDTELDKQVIEQLSDPLTHLVRNAIDHGIEPPEDRVKLGKPAEGRLRLSACHEGGNVILDVQEDGRGLNGELIRRKAVEKGLIRPEENLTPEQVRSLIFLPGFSTAAKITDISGRGVGLDVVKQNIEKLNGSIHVNSEPGKGTHFRIQLPLTLAILDGLTVQVGDEVYILPMLSVVESFRPKEADVVRVVGQRELVMVRGETIPLIRLHDVFGTTARHSDPCRGLVVMVEHLQQRVGLLVDDLLGQVQAVMKSLDRNYRKVDGLSGATILGNGSIALILDVAGLVQLSRTL